MRGQTLAGSASHQGTQHSSHGPSHPTCPQLPGSRGHPGIATTPALNTGCFPWSFSSHCCSPPQLQELLLAVLTRWTVPGRCGSCACPGGKGEQQGSAATPSVYTPSTPPSLLPGGEEAPHPEHNKHKYYKHYFRFLMLFHACHQAQLPQDDFRPSVLFYRDVPSCCLCLLLLFFLFAEVYACF